jgi:hypothetical protein
MDAAHKQVFKEFITELRAVNPVSKEWQNHINLLEITPALQEMFTRNGLTVVGSFVTPLAGVVFERYATRLAELEDEQ